MFYQNVVFCPSDKSSCTSQFITGKSRDLQKLPRYLSGTVTFTFKNDTDGCAGWRAFPEFFLLFPFYTKSIFHLKHYQ